MKKSLLAVMVLVMSLCVCQAEEMAEGSFSNSEVDQQSLRESEISMIVSSVDLEIQVLKVVASGTMSHFLAGTDDLQAINEWKFEIHAKNCIPLMRAAHVLLNDLQTFKETKLNTLQATDEKAFTSVRDEFFVLLERAKILQSWDNTMRDLHLAWINQKRYQSCCIKL